MTVIALSVIMAAAVAVLVRVEMKGRRDLVLVAKPAASLAFVLVGVSRFEPGHGYDAWVLLALLLCFAGDLLLMLRRGFVPGLVSFLLGHLAYVVAFSVLLLPRSWPIVWALPPLVVSTVAAAWLSPHLGRLRVPVLAYVAVITVMVWGAVAVTVVGRGPWFLAAGAILFYLSDLAVARDRLVTKAFGSRAWGLPAYYLGQLLLALTVGR
ncbi:MAG: lysoplasmalogenase [Thermoanaerobaculaceae bacterium]|nr:lysoplasmalogenase [Thermoanaerobaculaceae bacterium]